MKCYSAAFPELLVISTFEFPSPNKVAIEIIN